MIHHLLAVWLILSLWIGAGWSQEAGDLESILENFQGEDLYQTDFLEVLQDLQAHPISVQTASARELLKIPFLNEEQARAIVRYRNRQKTIERLEMLAALPELSRELLDAIRPYLTVAPPRAAPVLQYRSQLSRQLHRIRGFEQRAYKNPYQLYHRLNYQKDGRWQTGMLWEKDSGEANWFDLGSMFVQFLWPSANAAVVAGDFNLETGLGLVFNGAYGEPVSIESFQPFDRRLWRWRLKRSTDENAFLRGGMVAWDVLPHTSLMAAISRHALDAVVNNDSTRISSFDLSGLHRSESEQSKNNRVDETVYAAAAFREFGTGQFGIQYASIAYSLPLETKGDRSRRRWNYGSGFYSWQTGKLRLQGEAALLNGRIPALQQSLLLQDRDARFRYGAAVYYYHRDYWAYHSRGFGLVGGSAQNRAGYFLSLSYRLGGADLAAYFWNNKPANDDDGFRFLQRTSQFQWRQKWRESTFTLRFTHRVRNGNTGPGLLPEFNRENLRFQISTRLSPRFRLNHRLEVSWADSLLSDERNLGISFYQDWRYRLHSSWQLQFRYTQFDVPAYDLRVYEYENDLPGNFRNVLLSGRGYKWFILINYNPGRAWSFSFKYRDTWFPDEQQLGSGLQTIFGNRKKELRFQMSIKY